QIASLATVVTRAARQGDVTARALLERAGRALAEIALAVIRQLDRRESGIAVFTTGGGFRARPIIIETVRHGNGANSPNSTVAEAAFSPVVGALFLDLSAAESDLNDEVLNTIRATLPEAAASKYKERAEGSPE